MVNFSHARDNMVESQIHPMGIIWPGLLESFRNVPRELFVPEALQSVAYSERDLPFGNGRFLLDPVTQARMIQALEPQSHEVALDIGGLTGYCAAVLAPLVTTVIAVEESEDMVSRASDLWQQAGVFNATAVQGPLVQGYPRCAAYDMIFLGGAVAGIPETLISQLSPAGRMVLILKNPDRQVGTATLIRRHASKGYSTYALFETGGHYLPGFEASQPFQF